MDNIINKIEENFQIRIQKVQENLNFLRTQEESKILMEKLENMDESFFYNSFYPTLKPLNTLEGLEHTCNVLIQCLFDDMGVFLNKIITPTEKQMKDKLNNIFKIKGLPTKEYKLTEVLNFDDNGEWCNQDTFLMFINRKELNDINHINLEIELKKKMGNKEIDFSHLGNLSERFKNFNSENLEQLNSNVKQHFKL